ncbi:hypothetical protein AQUCO_01700263v1 [Aquilegia coerulea]|uniref:Uncharacterized protein n=1 Tax=Aquilegia coerulea TaxID=218851 RepID=A0A2G5DM11_AQUCA|nr:hypothetical protein AQUCO_01700263v1 [Aquilegia coerulea]
MEFGSSNDDIRIEVLSRVPVKSLLTSKCVSKRWQGIISETSFQRLHCRRTKPIISGFFFQCLMRCNINGLICCRNFGIGAQFVFICNPLKREFLQIKGPKGINGRRLRGLGFVFDPLCYSLDGTPSFKIVSVSKKKGFVFSFHIYSSKVREWRLSEEIYYDDCDLSLGGLGIFAGGVFYWLTGGNVVMAFDLEKGKSKCIDLTVPRIQRNEGLCEMCIGESEGCFYYILITDADLRVWALNRKIASGIVVGGLILPTWIEPIAFKDGNLLVKLRCRFNYERGGLEVCTKIYLYNLDAGTMKELCVLEELGLPVGYLRTIPYCMSFAPLLST